MTVPEKKSRRKATVARIRRVRRPAPKKPRQWPSPSEERVLYPNGVLIGYARVSTLDQNLTLQRDALTTAGCTKLFVEQMSGVVLERPMLRDALEFAREPTFRKPGIVEPNVAALRLITTRKQKTALDRQ